jgi:hypothetical protein
MKYYKRNSLVSVSWIDAESVDDWTFFGEVCDELPPVITVGLVIKQTKEIIIIACNHDTKNDSYSCIMKIPIGMVTEIKLLV